MLTAKQKGRNEQQHQQEILTFCFCIYHKTEPFYVKENRIKLTFQHNAKTLQTFAFTKESRNSFVERKKERRENKKKKEEEPENQRRKF